LGYTNINIVGGVLDETLQGSLNLKPMLKLTKDKKGLKKKMITHFHQLRLKFERFNIGFGYKLYLNM
jgi:hypothetical protein